MPNAIEEVLRHHPGVNRRRDDILTPSGALPKRDTCVRQASMDIN